ncbi:MAG: LysR family transcriptional regulator [Alphaproteobacteria bacterium]|nr:LysR family transcriptional regulator [Alphaproteobacteria bacterium]
MSVPVNRLKLRHFRLIQAIAASGQLSSAAQRVAMTQPAASRSLAEIEALVGAPLFDRHPKGMQPTALGEVLARRAGVLLSEIDEAAREAAAIKTGRAGTVRVGSVTGAAVGYIVPAVQALKAESRSAEIRIQVAPSVQLMDCLLDGALDFVLSRVPPEIDGGRLDILHGQVETLRFLVRASHPLRDQRRVELEALADLPWVIQERGTPIREAVDAAHIRAGLSPPSDVVDTASLLVTLAYLRRSNAIAPVASEVAHILSQTGLGDFAALEPAAQITLTPYHLIRQKDRPLGPIAERLLDLVKGELSA